MAEDDFDDDDFDEIVNQIDEVEKKKKAPSISWFNIQVSPEQALNPVLQRITKVPYQVSDIPTDFQTSHDVGILWLSLKYYNYRRTYIEERVEKLKDTSLKLIVVLLYVDNPNAEDAARTLSVLSCRLNFTLLVAFNLQEAASHIENFKRFANKGPETLKGKFDETDRVTKLLTIASGFNSSGEPFHYMAAINFAFRQCEPSSPNWFSRADCQDEQSWDRLHFWHWREKSCSVAGTHQYAI